MGAEGEPIQEHEKGDHEDDDGNEDDQHEGYPLVACDQSAITGESLAVDKYMGDTLYYTTGCKRGKVSACHRRYDAYATVSRNRIGLCNLFVVGQAILRWSYCGAGSRR